MNRQIISYINSNNWSEAKKLALQMEDINSLLDGKYNIYHYACLRGNNDAMENLETKSKINTATQDYEGNTGYHLYFKSGWTMHKKINFTKDILSVINNNFESLCDICIGNFDILNIIINKMIMFNCLDILKLKRVVFIYKLIVKTNNKKYCKLFQKIVENSGVSDYYYPLLPFAVKTKKIKGTKVLLSINNIDINILDLNQDSSLYHAIYNKDTKTTDILLDAGININYGGLMSDKYPIILAIKSGDESLIKNLLLKNAEVTIKDNFYNTPAHYALIMYTQHKISLEITKEILKLSDLNIQNNQGSTPLHYIIKHKLWDDFLDIIVKKKIDLTKLDSDNKNILGYLEKADHAKFLSIIELKRKNKDFIVLENQQEISLLQTPDTSNVSFRTDAIHTFIYYLMIMHKYNYVRLASQEYNYDKQKLELWKYSMTLTDPTNNYCEYLMKIITKYFFCFVPSFIVWMDKDIYYINENLALFIRKLINKKYKFILLTITILQKISPNAHANVLMFDVKNREAYRFEPYGVSSLCNTQDLDAIIKKVFSAVDKTITYYTPNDFLKDAIFQSASDDINVQKKKIGDPGGYCLAWCLWFVNLKIKNPTNKIKQLIDLAQKQILNSNKSYLTFIRNYANHLDKTKNIFLKKLGFTEDELYNLVIKNDFINKLSKYTNTLAMCIE